MRPSDEDDLPRKDDDPPNWHVREKTNAGYPLTGSSGAERAASAERAARIKAKSMRDHPFEGDSQYCQKWRVLTDRMTGSGRLVMRDQCGYRRDMHPESADSPSPA